MTVSRATACPLLFALACSEPTPPPTPELPAPQVEAQPAPAPSPPPAPTDLCTPDGWCRPYLAMSLLSAAADTEAVAVGDGAGMVALWVDGRWRGGFDAGPDSAVRAVRRSEVGVSVTTCQGSRCEQRTWTESGWSPAEPTDSPGTEQATVARLGSWSVEYSTLVGAGETPLRLKPKTALAGEGCAVAFGILGDAENPFVLCSHHTRRSLHHLIDGRLVPLLEPWDSTWVSEPVVVLEGAGCGPCLATDQGILLREDGGWAILPMPDLPTQGGLLPGHMPRTTGLQLAVDQGQVYVKVQSNIWAWDGASWSPAQRDGSWAAPLKGRPYGESTIYAGPTEQLMVGGPEGVAWRPWSALLPPDALPRGRSRVKGVAADDVLNVRVGPNADAAQVGHLAPDARCVSTLDLAPPDESPGWSAIALDDGVRGWVSSRYLEPELDCPD